MVAEDGLVNGAPSESVCVAVHIRPLIEQELEEGCAECLAVNPTAPQVYSGPHSFTLDHVFGGDCGQEASQLYDTCVSPLVNGLFKGYNATVFAYGQTGSGKTYTMGSAFPLTAQSSYSGVIPRAMDAIFKRTAEFPDRIFTIRVGFVEIHKEEIRDLLSKGRTGVHIRELPNGGIVLPGAIEKEVSTKEEMVKVLEQGTVLRATAETGMNKQSSRSHAIFTITVEQRKAPVAGAGAETTPGTAASTLSSKTRKVKDGGEDGEEESGSESDPDEVLEEDVDSYLCAKLHLVDLAGSERAKRTKAQGQRLQEGININKGLLALGNVINSLVEGKGHIPYRDSKLTRMLQDSLGGNSRTLMVACVSPADVNLEESVNTLRYASRARAIKNKPVVNRDPVAAQIAALRQQLVTAKAENLELRKRLGLEPTDEVDLMNDRDPGELSRALQEALGRITLLEHDVAHLHAENDELRKELKEATEAQFLAGLQRDKLKIALEEVAGTEVVQAALEAAKIADGEETVERTLAKRVHELEDEVRRLRVAGVSSPGNGTSPYPSSPLSPSTIAALSPFSDDENSSGTGFAAEERAHQAEMARVESEMDLLTQALERKEAAIAAVSNHSAMKETYETQLREVQAERDLLAKERSELLEKLQTLQATSVEERVRMEKSYKERIRQLDVQAKGVDKRERKIRELETMRNRAMDTVRALQSDIEGIKTQKASLQRQADKAAKDYTAWKRERDKEVMHLKKEGRANAAQLMRMEALHTKQQDVLRRKMEEAAAARKRLKLLEGKSAGSARSGGAGSSRFAPSGRTVSGQSATSRPPGVFDPDASEVLTPTTSSQQRGPVAPLKPNPAAPVLEGENSRREWVENELSACCSSYELQQVLQGDMAQRSEAQRQLREVERRLAALKNPQWWGESAGAHAGQLGEEALLKKKARLTNISARHGRQIQEVQLALVQARAQEEERGGGAADRARWASVPAPPEVQAMLTTMFRAASQYKAQSYEAQLAMTELGEKVEMLKLRLEVAEAEKLEMYMRQQQHSATSTPQKQQQQQPSQQRALEVHQTHQELTTPTRTHHNHPHDDDNDGNTPPRPAVHQDALDAEAAVVLKELDSLSQTPATDDDVVDHTGQDSEALQNSAASVSVPASKDADGLGGTIVSNTDTALDDGDDDDDLDDESFSSDDDDDENDSWDPSKATPSGNKSKKTARPPSPEEQAALAYFNSLRMAQGEDPLSRLTNAKLKDALQGATINGIEWKAGNKKRKELLTDYLRMIGVSMSTTTSASTPLGMHGHPTPDPTPTKQQLSNQTSAKKSPFSQLKDVLRRNKSQDVSETLDTVSANSTATATSTASVTPSRSRSLRSLAARALGSPQLLSQQKSSSSSVNMTMHAADSSGSGLDAALQGLDIDDENEDRQRPASAGAITTDTSDNLQRPSSSNGSRGGGPKKKAWIPS